MKKDEMKISRGAMEAMIAINHAAWGSKENSDGCWLTEEDFSDYEITEDDD